MYLASCSGCNGDTHILTFAAHSWRYWRRRSRERANLSVSRPLRGRWYLSKRFQGAPLEPPWGGAFWVRAFFSFFFLATVSHKQPRFLQVASHQIHCERCTERAAACCQFTCRNPMNPFRTQPMRRHQLRWTSMPPVSNSAHSGTPPRASHFRSCPKTKFTL